MTLAQQRRFLRIFKALTAESQRLARQLLRLSRAGCAGAHHVGSPRVPRRRGVPTAARARPGEAGAWAAAMIRGRFEHERLSTIDHHDNEDPDHNDHAE